MLKFIERKTLCSCFEILYHLLLSRLYCWFWNCTKSCALTLADFTANREFHPAPKTLLFSCSYQEYLLYRTPAIVLADFGNISEVCVRSEDIGIGAAVYQILVCYFTAHEHYQRYVANAEMLSLCDPSKERMLQNVWKKRAGFQLEIGRVVKKLQASTGYFFIKDKGVKKDESI